MNYRDTIPLHWYSSIRLLVVLTLGLCSALSCLAAKESVNRADGLIYAQVLKQDPVKSQILIQIEGEKEPLTVQVGLGDTEVTYTGRRIEGYLFKSQGSWRLEKIWPADLILRKQLSDQNRLLARETRDRGRGAYREKGEFMPDFACIDQCAQLFTGRQLKGRYVVMNFFFTGCAKPKMCPASIARMERLRQQVELKELNDQVSFVSMSFDPENDTPGTLKQYASRRSINSSNYYFISTPDRSAKNNLMRQLGVLVEKIDGTLDHTSATLLIGPSGKILYRNTSSHWTEALMLSQLEHFMTKEKSVKLAQDKAARS